MSRFTRLSAWALVLTLCSSAFADAPSNSEPVNAVVALNLKNYENKTQANPVIVASDGTSMEIVQAISTTLTKYEYSDAILCVTDSASSDYHMDIRIGIAISDGNAELFVGEDFPLSFANGLTDSLSHAGVKGIRLRCAKDFPPWAADYKPSPVSDGSDPFAASTIKKTRKQDDDPFKNSTRSN